ncbi:type I-C CRISPR-associated protein Cas8c/Csd1 [Nocardia terpenica]|uniref:type I-C CRISPR-associated protein Cas8c/Csd1 n=1 Tax=Nocardia terpenica TaxID=455432 RepID=UPI00189451E4|nr:type I-C CRISPR-associated protein Cas8c/Csd1 [Nocardia terpenica]MBF6062052.1 type I-C CRISPR-associated protein Cas8c/Csd1 [Nocardia terpenica]MBF6106148.1 type I-C CRISPR-associated protein Cas8c/Csd1 [Nocardia terpenica]MBF6110472.1 type I-C CRISPR-associated protein Cas8c/Csd1 [Nocardia terpenica]MBF6120691.1 type I-C CRISPR-associated protein Cas8c/Csd1 [Nocardia terpenica]MBF6151808.1 type I-C CRISPR-associated protein Cas8c/Csd1 [Nocardia terpenica]
MLIKRLVDSRSDDSVPRYYRTRTVRWAIMIDSSGDGHLVDRADTEFKAGSPVATPYLTRTSGVAPMLLTDTLEYVLGVAKDVPTKLAAGAREKALEKSLADADRRNGAYLSLLREWMESSGDPLAREVYDFFTAGGCLALFADPRLRDAKSSDLVAILAAGEMVHLRDSATAFWAQVAQARKSSGTERLCLSCFTAGPVLKTIPEMVKGTLIPVGVDSAGRPKRGRDAALVSVNTSAQGRMGTLQLVNTPICEDCGGKAMAALNSLLADPRHCRRGEDNVLTWWLREPEAEFDIRIIDAPSPGQVATLRDEVWAGETGTVVDENDFYAITLSANQSRVVVRDWIDVPVLEIKKRLRDWFDDHESTQQWANGVHQVGLKKMVHASGRWDKKRASYVPGSAAHGLERDLLRCALHGGPPPPSLVPRLLHRIRNDHHIDLARVAMLRLALNRPPYNKENVMPGLDETATDPAYVWGRMFAVLEAIQRKAIPDINATIRDRYFGLAMSQPAATMRMLRLNANGHLKKLTGREASRGAGRALDARLADVSSLLDRATGLPAHLDTYGQIQFILGYDHQRAADLTTARAVIATKDAKSADVVAADLIA